MSFFACGRAQANTKQLLAEHFRQWVGGVPSLAVGADDLKRQLKLLQNRVLNEQNKHAALEAEIFTLKVCVGPGGK